MAKGQGPNRETGENISQRPTSTRVWLGRCLYLHGSVGKWQGESSRRADGDYLMVSVDREYSASVDGDD